jgi:hypothetical protein
LEVLRFVARLLNGEKMGRLCREFEIFRKIGYKIFSRYKDCGVEGVTDRSRRPYAMAASCPFRSRRRCCRSSSSAPAGVLRISGNDRVASTARALGEVQRSIIRAL